MEVFLHSPQDFNNLCVFTRTLEVFGIRSCYVYDRYRLIRPRYGKSYRRRINKISAGAFFKVHFERVEDPLEFLRSYDGRTVATIIDQTGEPLTSVSFRESDMIVFGSETNGLDPNVIETCDLRITIPQQGTTHSLNLCVASGIILFEWLRQMRPLEISKVSPDTNRK